MRTHMRIAGLLVWGLIGTALVAQAPANATARCKDGTYSTATKSQGICSHHGGVAEKLTPKPAAKKPSSSGGHPAGATAKCKDGTYSHSQTRSGTCSHHGGVAEWY